MGVTQILLKFNEDEAMQSCLFPIDDRSKKDLLCGLVTNMTMALEGTPALTHVRKNPCSKKFLRFGHVTNDM